MSLEAVPFGASDREQLGVRLPVRKCGLFTTVDFGHFRREPLDMPLPRVPPDVALDGVYGVSEDRLTVAFRPRDPVPWVRVWGQAPTIFVGAGASPATSAEFLVAEPEESEGVFRCSVRYRTGTFPALDQEVHLRAENCPYALLRYGGRYPSAEDALKRAVDRAVGVPLAFGTAIRALPDEELWAAYTVEGEIEIDTFDGSVPMGTRFAVLFAGRSWVGDIPRCLAAELGARARVRVRAGTMSRGPDPTGIEALRSDVVDEGLRTMVLDVEVDR